MKRKFQAFLLVVSLVCFLRGNLFADNPEVIATVGRFAITKQDLLDSYEYGPGFVKRLPNPLRKHLEFMIDERLLALEAERLNYDTTQFVRERVAALEEDLTVDELYADKILSQAKVSDKKIVIHAIELSDAGPIFQGLETQALGAAVFDGFRQPFLFLNAIGADLHDAAGAVGHEDESLAVLLVFHHVERLVPIA